MALNVDDLLGLGDDVRWDNAGEIEISRRAITLREASKVERLILLKSFSHNRFETTDSLIDLLGPFSGLRELYITYAESYGNREGEIRIRELEAGV